MNIDDLTHMGTERYVPSKGWGYSVVAVPWNEYCKYEVCPFYDGDIPTDMDVIMCRDLKDVGEAIQMIMKGDEKHE